jgi:CubicO group peptidase (beta-lactamase class C family)
MIPSLNDVLRERLSQELKSAIAAQESRDAFSGTVLVSRGSDTLFAGAWGYASRAWKVPNTLDTLFTTASVTKTFTATAILQMVEAGQMRLDQPVHSLVPLRDSTISEEVTVAHLLTHTSGIGDYFPEDDEEWPRVFHTTPTYTLRRVADFLPLFIRLPAAFAPGARFSYSNAGYVLLGRIIELLTGEDYFTAIRRLILLPAGMDRACFPTVDTLCEGLADPHAVDGPGTEAARWRKCISTSIPPAPDGGLATTAPELDRFWRALVSGRLVGEALRRAMLSPQVPVTDGRSYGFGVHIFHHPVPPGLVRYEAHGFDSGVNAYAVHYPALDVNAIVLSNLDQGATGVFHALHALIAKHAALSSAPDMRIPPAGDLNIRKG